MDKEKAKWVTIGKAAKYIGVSPDTLRRWEKRGKIKAFRSPTNRRYYTKKQLKQVMEGKIVKPQVMAMPLAKITSPDFLLKFKKTTKLILIGFFSLIAAAVISFLIFSFLF